MLGTECVNPSYSSPPPNGLPGRLLEQLDGTFADLLDVESFLSNNPWPVT